MTPIARIVLLASIMAGVTSVAAPAASAQVAGAPFFWAVPLIARGPFPLPVTPVAARAATPAPAPVAPVRTAWVRARVTGADLVRTARTYIGVPYVLGGTTPRAFDCSGFVRWVFAQHGIGLPRTAHEQAAVGDAPEGDLQPGDLLFFWGGAGAQHIAIYVGGDTIIHASSRHRRVRLDRFSGARGKGWFGERLIAVRRVLPLEGYRREPAAVVEAAGAAGAAASPSNASTARHAGAGQLEERRR